MFYKKYTLHDKKVQYLTQTDEKLGKLINYIGNIEIAIENDGFKCLTKYIIGQQISDKARETIWKRAYNCFGDIDPALILSISDFELKSLGLSGRKIEYIKILAQCITDNKLDFSELEMCILRSLADSDAFQSGRCAAHNGRPETLAIIN